MMQMQGSKEETAEYYKKLFEEARDTVGFETVEQLSERLSGRWVNGDEGNRYENVGQYPWVTYYRIVRVVEVLESDYSRLYGEKIKAVCEYSAELIDRGEYQIAFPPYIKNPDIFGQGEITPKRGTLALIVNPLSVHTDMEMWRSLNDKMKSIQDSFETAYTTIRMCMFNKCGQ